MSVAARKNKRKSLEPKKLKTNYHSDLYGTTFTSGSVPLANQSNVANASGSSGSGALMRETDGPESTFDRNEKSAGDKHFGMILCDGSSLASLPSKNTGPRFSLQSLGHNSRFNASPDDEIPHLNADMVLGHSLYLQESYKKLLTNNLEKFHEDMRKMLAGAVGEDVRNRSNSRGSEDRSPESGKLSRSPSPLANSFAEHRFAPKRPRYALSGADECLTGWVPTLNFLQLQNQSHLVTHLPLLYQQPHAAGSPVQDQPLDLILPKPTCRADQESVKEKEPVSKVKSQKTKSKVTNKSSRSCQDKVTHKNYKNTTREKRIEANARERQRVHTITAAFDTLQAAIPTDEENIKLSKLSVVKIATAYIMALSRMAGYDYTEDRSAPSVESVLEHCRQTIANETKMRKRL